MANEQYLNHDWDMEVQLELASHCISLRFILNEKEEQVPTDSMGIEVDPD